MEDLEIGGLTFRVEYRLFGGDRGPAIRVFGLVDNELYQLLRFDCFEDDPHYHYDPTGENRMFHLDPLTMGCPLDFSLKQISKHVGTMIEEAGFAQVAAGVDQAEVTARVDEIRAAVGRVKEAALSEAS